MGNSVVTEGNGVRAGGPAAYAPVRPGTLPPDVRRILIVGAGGFGREVLQWARDAWPSACDRIAGFLSADAHRPPVDRRLPPILANPAAFHPEPGDALLLAIGIPAVRRRVAEDLASRKAVFLTLVHPTAIVASTASIGSGSILCPYSILSDSAKVGRFTLLNYHSSLAHDAAAGDFAVLSPYATLGGAAEIGTDAFLGLHASVGPSVRLGSQTKVSANSAALHDSSAHSLVFGVPGRTVYRVVTAEPSGEKQA
jgi:sugar O-acyltransferase (sialic acid O-acetyltransferase NeuD family)